MATTCMFCKEPLVHDDVIVELVIGRVKTNPYGGVTFRKDDAFPIQGYLHYHCIAKAATYEPGEKQQTLNIS